jgi:hypothetical protein
MAVGRRLDVASDEDGDDERVHGQDTGHDDGDERLAALDRASTDSASTAHLHNQVGPVCSNTSNADACLCGAIGSSHACAPLAPATPRSSGASGIRTSEDHLMAVRILVRRLRREAGTHRKRDSALVAVSYEVIKSTRGGAHHAEERREAGRKLIRRHGCVSLSCR